MEANILPRNKKELKEFILEIIGEISERFVPYVSEDEQKEIEELYGEALNEEYKEEEYVRL